MIKPSQFVKNLYPDAICKMYSYVNDELSKFGSEYRVYESPTSSYVIAWGPTPMNAWFWAMRVLNEQLMDKLEN